MAKWVAANEMVMIRIKNPVKSIILLNAKAKPEIPPEGVVASMGKAAVEALGQEYINNQVYFLPQMVREIFGNEEKDENLFACVPYQAIIALLQPEETDGAASH